MNNLRKKSIDYLSRREHSRLELKQKLSQKNFSDSDIAAELDFLISTDLQSDDRFAHAYVRSRKQAGFGPKRIELELRERGVAELLISAAIDAHSTEWQTQMIAVLQRKFPHPAKNQAEKAPQFRFLSQRGYNADMINNLLFSKVEKCAQDNPDLPIEFVEELLISVESDKSLAENFIFEDE